MNEQLKYYQQKLNYEMDSADLFEAFENNESIKVIDARKEVAFFEEHIPNAISFPHREMNEQSVSKLDKNTLYTTYCDGIGCNASTKGALKLAKYGFKVKELIGGLDWWKRDGYSTEGSNKTMGLDIRCNC